MTFVDSNTGGGGFTLCAFSFNNTVPLRISWNFVFNIPTLSVDMILFSCAYTRRVKSHAFLLIIATLNVKNNRFLSYTGEGLFCLSSDALIRPSLSRDANQPISRQVSLSKATMYGVWQQLHTLLSTPLTRTHKQVAVGTYERREKKYPCLTSGVS